MRAFRTAALAAALLSIASSAFALDTTKLKPTGYVNDFAHALDPGSAQALEAYCAEVERATGAQFAIVVVNTLEDEPIEDVANRLFRQWGVGKKGTDEGLMLLLAIKDRKQRAEVGFGLEPIVTDGYAGGVLRGIRPILQQGNYGGALLAAAQQFGSHIAQAKGVAIAGEQLPAAQPAHQQGGPVGFFGIIFLIIVVIFILKMGSGRSGGSGGSGVGGFLTGMILGNVLGGGRRNDWGGGGFGGGGFGGGGGGGGGFGGFGGGDSGGGGASGGW